MKKGYLIGLSLQTNPAAKSSVIRPATLTILKPLIVAKYALAQRLFIRCSQ
jgi:hypothetical protein